METNGGSASTVVEVRALSKRYGTGGRKRDASVTQALDRVSFAVARGEFAGVMGPSGSGKSTLLNCLATIDAPTSGSIVIGGRDVTSLAGKELAKFRREDLGFIFPDSNLLDTLTAYENIALALTIQKVPARCGGARHGDPSAPRAGRRAHGRAGFEVGGRASRIARAPQQGGVHHPHGHA